MGFFLSNIRGQLHTLAEKLPSHSHTLERVREYHGIFKSVCDSFVIKASQFQQIFGGDENFSFWSNDSVNALELFCGLAFYARECSFRSKVRFLFCLFDFNEIKSISIVDLQYMLLSVCNFTYKVLGKVNTKADELRSAEWLIKYLDPKKRITVTRLYRLCGQALQLQDLLAIAGATKEQFLSVQSLSEEPGAECANDTFDKKQEAQSQINTKLGWFSSFCSKLAKPKYKKEVVTRSHLNWIYGIELKAIRHPFQSISGPIAIYAVSNKMIVFNQQSKKQLFYTQHQRQITCFCLRREDRIVASAQGKKRPSIHIWNYHSLEAISIIRLDHKDPISLMIFSQYEPLLAVSLERSTSPFLLFQTVTWTLKTSFCHTQPIRQLVSFGSNIPQNQIPPYLLSFFIFSGAHSLSVIDEQGVQYQNSYESQITALAVSYMNSSFPYLRYFHAENLRLFIVTGHISGAVNVWQVAQDSPFDALELDKFQAIKMDEPITQLVMNEQALFVASGQEIRIYDLTTLILKENKTETQPRCIRLNDYDNLKLISTTICHISVTDQEICILTDEGDLVIVGDREIVWKDSTFVEQESLRRVNTVAKLNGQMRAMCFLERQLDNVLLIVSQGRRILQIDPDSHEVTLILDIGMDDFVNVIDSAVTEDGGGLTVCGCKSGKLILRNDWQQIGKVIDCGAEISDLKISPEGNTLLVATTNTLLFFHLGTSLSSPRKLTFQNESPISLGFLDNPKFCAITTTAKNVYLLELPSLKHRSVLKEVDSFAASTLPVSFSLPAQKVGVPAKCIVGSDIKFYLISLDDGGILFFPSMSCLQRKDYVKLKAHLCPLVNLAITEDQGSFYTLGQKDQMLLEWSVQQRKPVFPGVANKQKDKPTSSRLPLMKYDWQKGFKRMKLVSESAAQQIDFSLCTFFFRGTKEKKLNRRLRSQSNKLENLTSEQLLLTKRKPPLSLQTKMVYGLEADKNNQVLYRNNNLDNSNILYIASRFLLQTNANAFEQEITECQSKKVSFIAINYQSEVIWAEAGPSPWIWKNGKRCVQTSHSSGLIHFALYKEFILSYGISDNVYTINVHNYCTQQLLAERTTDKEIISFIMLNSREFISLAEVRWWKDLVESQILGLAASGVVLHNGKDICLGGISGQLSILGRYGIVEVAKQAHYKQITAMKTNLRENIPELVTASLDQTIKVWNSYFEQLIVISLNFQEEFSLLHEIQNEPAKSPMVCVNSLDCKGNRIIATLSHGQIWEFTITTHYESVLEGPEIGSQISILSDSNDREISPIKMPQNDKKQLVYKVHNQKVLDCHCSTMPPNERYLVFDVHTNFPIIATAANDGRLILRDYERNVLLGNYLCEDRRQVRALKFSPHGRMLVVGLSGGIILTFYLMLIEGSREEIVQLNLKYFQTFKSQRSSTSEVVSIEFNESGQLFCVSFWHQPKQKYSNQSIGSNYIKVFRMKSEKNSNTQQAFYQERQIIELRQEQKSNSGLSKCVLRMYWQEINGKHFIIIYSQYLNAQTRYKLTHKGKYEAYCLEDKAYLSDQFAINWPQHVFPNLLHTLAVGSNDQPVTEEYYLTALYVHKNTLFCGGIDGRVHLVRSEALVGEESITDYKEEDMCLSRVYNSHSSFISKICVSSNEKTGKTYVFTTAYGDQTLVQFEVLQQSSNYFLENKPYPKEVSDQFLHGECLPRDHFYLMLNNLHPLREELTAVLEDVQKGFGSSISLTSVRLFGRRASDRRYNLAFFQGSALYSLGPNIIIQSLKNAEEQEVMKADPSPLSYCPQISTFHYEGSWLGVVTQEEHSSLFVWDIRSQSCLSSMSLQCSLVQMVRFSGDSNAILYGLNDHYQLVVEVVDWKARKALGISRLAHSGNVAIRDICTYSSKSCGLQFITCGYMHLCYWQLRGDSLVSYSFNTLMDGRYLSVRSMGSYILTGTQEGDLYLWYQFQIVHSLKEMHKAAVRCIEVDVNNEIFISGGKDGLLIFIRIEDNRLEVINRADLAQWQLSEIDLEDVQSWKVEHQVQAIAVNYQPLTSDWEKILVGTRSGAIYEVKFNDQFDNTQVNLFQEGHDHQAISGVAFSSIDPNFFFILTNAGIIQKWSLKSLTKQFSFELGKKAVKLQSCGQHLLVCCRNEVLVYRVLQQSLQREDELCIDTRRSRESEGEQSKESQIIKICLSQNRVNLAVCIKICTKQPLYQISLYQFGKSKDPFHTINNLKHQIDYLDFSLDDKYLLFKDRYEEIAMINLDAEKDYRRINTIFVEMAIEWQEEGLRISPKGQKIYYSYSCENKITAITRLGKDKIVVGDEMGTIRIFDYPCSDDRLGELHLQCYTNHMNGIDVIRVHPLLTHVISTSLSDRCLILWKVQ